MGMGEPLLNLPSVLRAHSFLNQDLKIGQRNMTISTVGVPNSIMKLASSNLQSTLAISIHAPNQQLREQLIPRLASERVACSKACTVACTVACAVACTVACAVACTVACTVVVCMFCSVTIWCAMHMHTLLWLCEFAIVVLMPCTTTDLALHLLCCITLVMGHEVMQRWLMRVQSCCLLNWLALGLLLTAHCLMDKLSQNFVLNTGVDTAVCLIDCTVVTEPCSTGSK